MNLNVSHHTNKPHDINVHPDKGDYAVQVFIGGSAYIDLYMSVEEARQFANDLLSALPVEAVAA